MQKGKEYQDAKSIKFQNINASKDKKYYKN